MSEHRREVTASSVGAGMADEELESLAREAAGDLVEAQRTAVELELDVLRRYIMGAPASARVRVGAGQQAEQTVDGDQRAPFVGLAVLNPTPVAVGLGFEAGGGTPQFAPFTIPAYSWMVLPIRFVSASIGVSALDAVGPNYTVTLVRLRVPPLGIHAGPLGSSGTVDVTDRAGRLLGLVAPAGGSTWDVSDRAGRLLGVEQGGIADSIVASGAVTSPGAGAAIASIAAPGAGVYAVQATTWAADTAEVVANAFNLRLRHGAVSAGNLSSRSATPVTITRERLTVAAGEAIDVIAIAAATVGATYNAVIAATRIA